MNWLLQTLETLAKYGIIDIFFGLGILAYIRRKFRKRSVKSIDGVDISPRIFVTEEGGIFELTIKNVSTSPLYLYRTYLLPGYYASNLDKSTLGSFFRTLLFYARVNDKVPRFCDRRNTQGEYPLLADTLEVAQADSVSILPGKEAQYYLGFEADDEITQRKPEYWDSVLENHQCGLLRSLFVHGAKSGLLETQL